MTSMTDVAAEGAAMRYDIHNRFEQIRTTGRLSGSARGNDIHAVVQKYLPARTRLSRAEELLRHAGFDIEAHQPEHADGGKTALSVRATSRTIVKGTAFGISDEVVVELDISGADADPEVMLVAAHIYVTSL